MPFIGGLDIPKNVGSENIFEKAGHWRGGNPLKCPDFDNWLFLFIELPK